MKIWLILSMVLLLNACASGPHRNPGTMGYNQDSASTYIVQKGDTLYGIARRFTIDHSALERLNHLSPPYKILVGQRLEMPPHYNDNRPAVAAAPTLTTAPRPDIDAEQLPPPLPPKVASTAPTALAPTPEILEKPPSISSKVADNQEPIATPPTGFLWPVKGEIISDFGPKPGGLHNDGINIAADEGTSVRSAAAGTVAYAGNELRGFGNLILIRHADGWVTAYGHLAAIAVKKGEVVKLGQRVGTVGQTGSVDSPQLHFELRHGKEPIDPTGHLSG